MKKHSAFCCIGILAFGLIGLFSLAAAQAQAQPIQLGGQPPLAAAEHQAAQPVTTDFSQPAAAQPPSALYAVENIAVDVKASSAAAARDKALLDGQRTALAELMARLGVGRFDASQVSDGRLAQIVQSFEIVSEKSSSVRYIASLNVRFKPAEVQNMLGGIGLANATAPNLLAVVLPISMNNGRPVLWEERTAWRAACEKLTRTQDTLLPLMVPPGELNDVGAISAHDALTGNGNAFNAIARNYNAAQIVVAQIEADADALDATKPLQISVSRFDSLGNRLNHNMLSAPPAENAEAQLAAAVRAVEDQLWKYRKDNAAAVNAGIPGSMSFQIDPGMTNTKTSLPVNAAIASLAELSDLRHKLGQVSGLQRAEITSLRYGTADMRLDFDGTMMQLQQNLAQQNISLAQSPEGVWRLQKH